MVRERLPKGYFCIIILLFTSALCFKCSVDASIAFDSFEWDFSSLKSTTANMDGSVKDNYLLYWDLDHSVNVEDAGYLCQKSYACIEAVTEGDFIPSGNKPVCTSLFGDDDLPPTAGRRLLFQTIVSNQTDFSTEKFIITSSTTYIDMICPRADIFPYLVDQIPEASDPVYTKYIMDITKNKSYVPTQNYIISQNETDVYVYNDIYLTLYSLSACPYHTQTTAKELIIVLIILLIIVIYLVPVMLIKRYVFLYHGGETYPNYDFWCLFKRCFKLGLKTILSPIIKLKVFFKVRKQAKLEAKKAKIDYMKQITPYIDCDVPIPFRIQQTLAVHYGYKAPQPGQNALGPNDEGFSTVTSEQSTSAKGGSDKKNQKVENFKKMWKTAMTLMSSRVDKALLPDISSSSVRDRSLSKLFLTSFVDVQFRLTKTTKIKSIKVPSNPKSKGYLEAKVANNARIEKLKRLFGGENYEEEEEESLPLESEADF